MKQVQHFDLLAKANRHYRRARAKNPSLPALVKGGGRVIANGKLLVELARTDGSIVTLSAIPTTAWNFVEVEGAKHPAAPAEASPTDRVKAAFDVVAAFVAIAAPLIEEAGQ
jgi:hypothetical protein